MFEALESRMLLSAAPSNVSASVTAQSDVRIRWQDNTSHEQGFYVERADPGVKNPDGSPRFRTIARTNPNCEAFTDCTPLVGKTYSYRVRSFDSWYVRTSNAVKVTVKSPPVIVRAIFNTTKPIAFVGPKRDLLEMLA